MFPEPFRSHLVDEQPRWRRVWPLLAFLTVLAALTRRVSDISTRYRRPLAGDPDALAGALRSMLADSRLAETVAVAADARAAEFAMDRLAERYLELYAEVAGRARKH